MHWVFVSPLLSLFTSMNPCVSSKYSFGIVDGTLDMTYFVFWIQGDIILNCTGLLSSTLIDKICSIVSTLIVFSSVAPSFVCFT